jgi:hypothetical protein
MRLPKLVGLQALETDNADTVTFQFKSIDGRSHYVPMRAGVLNALVPDIINVQKADASVIGAQPVTLTAVRGAYHQDGSPMLELGLDGIRVVVALDLRDTVPRLIEILTGFQSRPEQSQARH